jgi:hypothetical protein
METPTSAIRDFLTAVDRGYLGSMPAGFNDSAFVKALREQAGSDDALALEYERGKLHGSDDRRMIEQQNRVQGQEIDRLKGEIAKLKRDLHAVANR